MSSSKGISCRNPPRMSLTDGAASVTRSVRGPQIHVSLLFLGRETEMTQLDLFLRRSNQLKCQVAILHGMPGVGKTEIALQHIYHRTKGLNPPSCVFWVDASTMETMERDAMRYTPGCTTMSAGLTSPSAPVKTWLANMILDECSMAGLLILDNMTDSSFPVVQRLVSETRPIDKVIVTTRSASLAAMLGGGQSEASRGLAVVQPLALAPAVELLAGSMGVRDQPGLAKLAKRLPICDVVHALDYNPLLIRQAAAYFISQNLELKRVSSFHVETIMLRAVSTRFDRLAESFCAPYAESLRRFEMERQVGADLLRVLSFLFHKKIYLDVFVKGLCSGQPDQVLSTVRELDDPTLENRLIRLHALLAGSEVGVILDGLQAIGLLQRTGSKLKAISFNSILYPHAIRIYLMPTRRERLAWLSITIRLFETGIALKEPKSDQDVWRRLTKYGRHIAQLFEHCGIMQQHSEFLCGLVHLYTDQLLEEGKYSEAIALKEPLIAATLAVHGAASIYLFERQDSLIQAYIKFHTFSQGSKSILKRAEEMALSNYESARPSFSETDPLTCQAACTYATILILRSSKSLRRECAPGQTSSALRRERLDKAETLLRASIQHISLLGDRHKGEAGKAGGGGSGDDELLQLQLLLQDQLVLQKLAFYRDVPSSSSSGPRLLHEARELAARVLFAKLAALGTSRHHGVYASAFNHALATRALFEACGRRGGVGGGGRRRMPSEAAVQLLEASVGLMDEVHRWRSLYCGPSHPETLQAETLLAEWMAKDAAEYDEVYMKHLTGP